MFTATAAHRSSGARRNPVSAIAAAMDCWRSRRALARLDAAALADIGVSVEQARAERSRHVWDVPSNWLR